MLSLSKIYSLVLSMVVRFCLYLPGIYGEESDLPSPTSTMDPIYAFYFAIISFLSSFADYCYFRLYGTAPQ
ncbi:hypothetical protein NPIL_589031 [Nephila pilipes]|uniref:Uncharacterized protein n=1 Tax=Nephila pilipes TaxID=299642 RepID=A0A8X6NXJ9_NEPPI|nr:hypothetical protein NPIL_589031 [Nephila pilipes]